MKITSKDIIKILSFDDEIKKKLLTEWDTYSEDQRINLEEIIWDAYADIYQIQYEMNMEIALQGVSKGEQSLDTKFAQRIREQTDDEFEQIFQHGVPAANLVETREKLQDLLKKAVTDGTTATTEENNTATENHSN